MAIAGNEILKRLLRKSGIEEEARIKEAWQKHELIIQNEMDKCRQELEPLSDIKLILRTLASLVSHNTPNEIYYEIMASVLRERAEN